MTLLSLLVAVIIIALLWWAIQSVLHAFAIGDPIATVVKVAFVVLVVLYLVAMLGSHGMPRLVW